MTAPAASRTTARTAARPSSRRRLRRFQQLELAFESAPPRWTFSRPALESRHLRRMQERLDFVRGFFPELDGITVRVGLARKRGVLGWGSLDPEQPGVWIRPRRLESFTIAHELTHLLQARGLVPGGERACDLWALARSPLVIDAMPGYLRLPPALRRRTTVDGAEAALLHRLAREAIEARGQGDRRYLSRFERELRVRWTPAERRRGAARSAGVVTTILDLLRPRRGTGA